MNSLVFPVGHYLGAAHTGPDHDDASHVVRIGWRTYELDNDGEVAIWALAHGLPEGPAGPPWTRAALEGAVRATGIPGATGVLDDLIKRDLIIEFDPGTPEAVELARMVRLRSLLVGFGNDRADLLSYGIGTTATGPVVKVPAFTYELWKWGHTCDNLWHITELLSEAATPTQLLTRCLHSIQTLISHGAAYLDEARDL
ncbi:hypothetical protein [Kribbella sp. NPDC055071]